MHGQHIVTAGVLDVQEVFLGGYFAGGYELDSFLFAAMRVIEQVAEVAHALGLRQLLAHLVDVALLLGRVGHLQDEARMAAVVVIPVTGVKKRLRKALIFLGGGGDCVRFSA